MDRSKVKKISLIRGGGGGAFLSQKTKLLKIPEMDRSKVKNFLSSWRGAFQPQKANLLKSPEMDRSKVRIISLILGVGVGLFCHKNISCSKLPEMDKSEDKKISLIQGGWCFSTTKTKVAQNHLKCDRSNDAWNILSVLWRGLSVTKTKLCCNNEPEMSRSKRQKIFPHPGGGCFSATKSKLAQNHLKWIDPKSEKFSLILRGGLFCHKNQSCSKLPEMDESEVKKISLILGGGLFCQLVNNVIFNDAWNISPVKLHHVLQHELSISPKGRKEGGTFLPQKPNLLKITWNG